MRHLIRLLGISSLGLCAAVTAMAASPSAPSMLPIRLDSDLLMVFGGPKAGEEAAFAQWSDRQVRALAAVPGVERALRLAIDAGGGGGRPGGAAKPMPESVIFYEVTAAAQPRLNDEVAARMKGGRIGPPVGADPTKTRTLLWRPLGPAVNAADVPGTTRAPAGPGELKDYYFAVLSDAATPDQEDEYNRWYNLQHVPDVLRVPGFRTAQRFIRIGGAGDAARYLVIFRLASRNLAATNQEVGRRIREKITVMSPAFGAQNAMSFTAQPVGAIARGR